MVNNDTTMMSIAYIVSQQSKCVSWAVGAVIEKDGRIISTGYNGTPARMTNCCDHAKDVGWMIEKEATNKSYVPDGAHMMVRSKYRGAVKYGHEIDSYYKNVDGVAYVWTNDFFYTNKFKHDEGGTEFGWYPTTFFSQVHRNGEVIWMADNLDPTTLKPKVIFDTSKREEHSEWSKHNEIHAEINSILYAAKRGTSIDGATMYVTISPCSECAKNIAQSGIQRLVFAEVYDRGSCGWSQILEKAGIIVEHVDKSHLNLIKFGDTGIISQRGIENVIN